MTAAPGKGGATDWLAFIVARMVPFWRPVRWIKDWPFVKAAFGHCFALLT
ncbi:hypothetical protein [Acidocella aminolytica]|uniref:Uncharacterized protein n=1 Tax=Acidocella aminolytica 101 = DSM 11237 TaxID=1120923 RepID=A0A0D6PKG3_9PROT|nr:hypothetical protein [Acidocella aminolytica]GAN82147.1 hypothetical protein Aam_167_005 [Acidocella aminolytica 101 = DSM 11237]GBQ35331.1 hypothetical protein AA11237_0946 [Acidocella aminolytica 101 = DSM 11237]